MGQNLTGLQRRHKRNLRCNQSEANARKTSILRQRKKELNSSSVTSVYAEVNLETNQNEEGACAPVIKDEDVQALVHAIELRRTPLPDIPQDEKVKPYSLQELSNSLTLDVGNVYTANRASMALPSPPAESKSPTEDPVSTSDAYENLIHHKDHSADADGANVSDYNLSDAEDGDVSYMTMKEFDYLKTSMWTTRNSPNDDLIETNAVVPRKIDKVSPLTARPANSVVSIVDRVNSPHVQETTQQFGKPVSSVIDCLPHNARFSETIMFCVSIRNRTEAEQLEVLYSPTDANEDLQWQKLLAVDGTNGIVLTDHADPPNFVVLPSRDGDPVVFLLRHFCSFVVIENGRKETINFATMSIYLKSYLSASNLVVDLQVIAGCKDGSMNDCQQFALNQGFKQVLLKPMTVYASKDDIQVELGDISWKKDVVKHNDRQLMLNKLQILHGSYDTCTFTQEFRDANSRKCHFTAELKIRQLPDEKSSTFSVSWPLNSEMLKKNHSKVTSCKVNKSSSQACAPDSSGPVYLTCSSSEMGRPITIDKSRDVYIEHKCDRNFVSSLQLKDDRSVEDQPNSLEEQEEVEEEDEDHEYHSTIHTHDESNVNLIKLTNSSGIADDYVQAQIDNSNAPGTMRKEIHQEPRQILNEAAGGVAPLGQPNDISNANANVIKDSQNTSNPCVFNNGKIPAKLSTPEAINLCDVLIDFVARYQSSSKLNDDINAVTDDDRRRRHVIIVPNEQLFPLSKH